MENKISSVLEIGSGSSINLFVLQKKLNKVDFKGVDLVEERIKTGIDYFNSKNYYPNVSVAEATALPFEANSFDLVFRVHCFEQINHYAEQCFREATGGQNWSHFLDRIGSTPIGHKDFF